jgi:uncharacterized protein
MKRLLLVVPALGVLLASAAAPAFDLPPRPGRYTTDRAGVLGADRERALDEKLASFERATSNQVVVYVDKKMPENTTIEDVANRAFHEWAIGQKGTSNGVLFLVFVDDKKMRIEVGRGLEGAIPDILAGRILREEVRPRFANGDFAGGVEAGVDAILTLARGEPYKGTGKTAAETRVHRGDASAWIVFICFFGVIFGTFAFVIIMIFRKAGRQGWRSVVANGVEVGSSGGGWSSSDSSSSSSDSGGGSDFSGGGGDSGGGGASDSW